MKTQDILYDIDAIKRKLEEAVVTEGCDKGVFLLDLEATTHYNEELKHPVYDYVYFSELGDCLVELHNMIVELNLKLLHS